MYGEKVALREETKNVLLSDREIFRKYSAAAEQGDAEA